MFHKAAMNSNRRAEAACSGVAGRAAARKYAALRSSPPNRAEGVRASVQADPRPETFSWFRSTQPSWFGRLLFALCWCAYFAKARRIRTSSGEKEKISIWDMALAAARHAACETLKEGPLSRYNRRQRTFGASHDPSC
jgi:hypothetical protein